MQPPIEGIITPVLPARGRRLPDRDIFVVVMLAVLLAVLVRPWARSGSVLGDTAVEQAAHMGKEALNPWLLPALGLVWVLVAGGLDLSVWVVFALGAVVGARIGAAGGPPQLMLAGVVGSGLAVGLVHAVAVGRLRLPSWGVTLITGTIGVSVVAALAGGEILSLPTSPEHSWPGQGRPMLLVGTFYIVALLAALLLGEGRRPIRKGDRTVLAYILIASSVLSAVGGLCWLIQWGEAPKPGHLVADLRVAAAAVLAGAAILKGLGRRLIASLLLLPAMLVATIWWQCVWYYTPMLPAGANLALLVAMVLPVQWAWLRSRRAGRAGSIIWPVLAVAGIAVLAGSAWGASPAALRWVGLGLWAVGIAAAAGAALKGSGGDRRRARR